MTVERASMEDEDLLLLRAFEPVVRLTQGEFFMPVGVDEYVRHASLWRVGSQGDMERGTDVGELDLGELALPIGGRALQLGVDDGELVLGLVAGLDQRLRVV